ncbi:MAG TPA: hypothetical protein VGQ42_10465 [Candidatus Dormibacteraeota bacterium]|jgi:hypothetical protein|nr:hypothetical protein [Candidatus Dormibacteraeota bacterium]
MPLREIIGKSIGFGLVSLACIAGGFFVFYGPHAYNDYVNVWLYAFLWLVGVGVAGAGALIILGIIADTRARQKEEELHVTPRPGPLGPPPPWGMGDVGRPGSGVVKMSEHGVAAGGGGRVRVVQARLSYIDAPILIGLLLVWTAVMLVWLAPR